MVSRFFEAFIPLLMAIDPIGLLPIFLALTAKMTRPERRRVSLQATLVGFSICVGFMLLGDALFHFLHIRTEDFQLAGGLLLLLLAMTDLLMVGKPAVHDSQMVGLVPLGMPLIAGPATLTATLVLANRPDLGYAYTAPALIATFAVLLVVLLLSDRILHLIGIHTLEALSKLVMILLAAIAVSYIRQGLTTMLGR